MDTAESGANFTHRQNEAQTPSYTFSAGLSYNFPQFAQTGWDEGRAAVEALPGAVASVQPLTFSSFLLQTGTPIRVPDASNFTYHLGNLEDSGRPDLFCLKRTATGSGRLEVHVLSGSSNYQRFILQTATPIPEGEAAHFEFKLGDFTGCRRTDLICIKRTATGSGRHEAHVLSARSNFQEWLLHTPIPPSPTPESSKYAVADFSGDGRVDLLRIDPGTRDGTPKSKTSVFAHELQYQGTFVNQAVSELLEADREIHTDPHKGDVYCLSRKGNVEVRVLEARPVPGEPYTVNGRRGAQTVWEAGLPSRIQYAFGDFNRNGRPDLFCFVKTETGTSSLEVHILG